MYYTYILKCVDNSYYTGVTNNVERRLWEHNEGITDDSYTKSRLPVCLVYYEEYQNVNDAIAREKQIKGWSRAKKIARSKGQVDELKKLSRSHASTGSA